MSKNRKLVIDQDKWLNASPSGKLSTDSDDVREDEEAGSSLLGPKTGRMCCLGFAAKKAGLKNLDILGVALPSRLRGEARKKFYDMFPWLSYERDNTSGIMAVNALTGINDEGNLTLAERKRGIKKIFAEHGWDVEFVRSGKK